MRTTAWWERVAGMPPGPELAAALATFVLAEVPNDLVIAVLRAQARQLAHEQARMLAALVEVAGPRRAPVPIYGALTSPTRGPPERSPPRSP